VIFACLFTVLATPAQRAEAAADYAREDRWAEQIVPGIVVGDAMYLATPTRTRVLALYTAVDHPRGGVIVVHGAGVHPDWGLIGGLRSGLADAGFATLSVQMPVLAAGAPREDYVALQGEAGERLAAAVAFLEARAIKRIAIVAHSMGAGMVNAYLASPRAARIDALVAIGMWGAFAIAPREPVLDVIAESDFLEVRESWPKRSSQLPRDVCSKGQVIAGTDHYFENSQKELVAAITPFLRRALDGGCR
jgi:pimeloyl-ACP methyl ester carboxylesterase